MISLHKGPYFAIYDNYRMMNHIILQTSNLTLASTVLLLRTWLPWLSPAFCDTDLFLITRYHFIVIYCCMDSLFNYAPTLILLPCGLAAILQLHRCVATRTRKLHRPLFINHFCELSFPYKYRFLTAFLFIASRGLLAVE